jgi:hypothetical protein
MKMINHIGLPAWRFTDLAQSSWRFMLPFDSALP